MRGLAAFILMSTFNVIQTLNVPKLSYLTEAGVGDTVTLICNISGQEKGLFYWYKLNYAHMVQTVVKGSFGRVHLEGEFKNSRLKKITMVGDVYSLTLAKVSKEDEAMYFCQAGTAYLLDFINATHLTVNQNDFEKQPKSSFIMQSSDVKSNQMKDLVTLQCSVLPENKDNSEECSGRRCVHQLFKGRKSLFGDETKLKTGIHLEHVVIGLSVLLALCVVVIAVLIISRH